MTRRTRTKSPRCLIKIGEKERRRVGDGNRTTLGKRTTFYFCLNCSLNRGCYLKFNHVSMSPKVRYSPRRWLTPLQNSIKALQYGACGWVENKIAPGSLCVVDRKGQAQRQGGKKKQCGGGFLSTCYCK